MKCIAVSCFIFIYVIGMIKHTHGTCVLESDFGFIINCAFKQSGLFRIRNLGGLKAHFGLGFSLGDELGLAESLGNTEGNKRRALNLRTGTNSMGAGVGSGVLPASRMPPTNATPMQNRPNGMSSRPAQNVQQTAMSQKPTVGTIMYRQPAGNGGTINTMTRATSLPLGVPAFRPIPKNEIVHNGNRKVSTSAVQQYQIQNSINLVSDSNSRPVRMPPVSQSLVQSQPQSNFQTQQMSFNQNIPSFQSMPLSVSRISTVSNNQNDNMMKQQYTPQGFKTPNLPQPKIDLMGHTVEELAAVANVSVETIQAAIKMRQQEIMAQEQANIFKVAFAPMTTQVPITTQTPTTTSTTTRRPTTSRYPMAGGSKVMNAPKEYYPVGYEKNFDDNFTSKVDLPGTSFHCGNEKHFPGLYADEDLGCMVFHVCALTDDGLIMKSFLCPESTLFDQTILKCNWWFYVDCKSSRSLYDSNIPVSKSYQLMKALTFFSNYKNSPNDKDGVDVEALKNSVSNNGLTL